MEEGLISGTIFNRKAIDISRSPVTCCSVSGLVNIK